MSKLIEKIKNIKTTFILPDSFSSFRRKNIYDALVPTGIYEICYTLNLNGHDTQIIDCQSDDKEEIDINRTIHIFNPNIICVCVNHRFEDFELLWEKLDAKNKKRHYLLFGCGVLDYSNVLLHSHNIEFVVPSLAEQVIPQIIMAIAQSKAISNMEGVAQKLDGSIFFTPLKKVDLTALFPPIDASLLISNVNPVQAYLWASKGCWHGLCTFCTVAATFRKPNKWIARPLDEIMQSIEMVHKKGVRRIHFLDDQFIGPGETGKKRTLLFADMMKRLEINIEFTIRCRIDSIDKILIKKLEEVGLVGIFIGIESCSDKTLKSLQKGVTFNDIYNKWSEIQDSGKVHLHTNFMLAHPETTIADLKSHINGIKQLYKNNYQKININSLFHVLHLHAGTILYNQVYNENEQWYSEIPCPYWDEDTCLCVQIIQKLYINIQNLLKKIELIDDSKYKNHCTYLLKVYTICALTSIVEQWDSNKPYPDSIIMAEFKKLYEFEKKYLCNKSNLEN